MTVIQERIQDVSVIRRYIRDSMQCILYKVKPWEDYPTYHRNLNIYL